MLDIIRKNDIILEEGLGNPLIITTRPFTWLGTIRNESSSDAYAIALENKALLPFKARCSNDDTIIFSHTLLQQHSDKKEIINMLIVKHNEHENTLTVIFIEGYTRYHYEYIYRIKHDGTYKLKRIIENKTQFAKSPLEEIVGYKTSELKMSDVNNVSEILYRIRGMTSLILVRGFSDMMLHKI